MAKQKFKSMKNKDEFKNICQIVLQNGKIYLFKFAVFIFIAITLMIKVRQGDVSSIKKEDFIGMFTFAITVAIDSVVLCKSLGSQIKGNIIIFHFCFFVLLLASVVFVGLIFSGTVNITPGTVRTCNALNFFYCLSPFLELGYNTVLHIENEKIKNYK